MKKYVYCLSHGLACFKDGVLVKIWDEDGKETTEARRAGCHVLDPTLHGTRLSTSKIISEEEAVLWLLAR